MLYVTTLVSAVKAMLFPGELPGLPSCFLWDTALTFVRAFTFPQTSVQVFLAMPVYLNAGIFCFQMINQLVIKVNGIQFGVIQDSLNPALDVTKSISVILSTHNAGIEIK